MFLDHLIIEADRVLRTLSGTSAQRRPTPKSTISAQSAEIMLSEAEKKHAAGLMRVNHVGEICAQALYQAQISPSDNPGLAWLCVQQPVLRMHIGSPDIAWQRMRQQHRQERFASSR